MEPLSGGSAAVSTQLGAAPGRDCGSSSSSSSSSSSPHSKPELVQPYSASSSSSSSSSSSPLKPNQVGETSLYGVPIVSLVIDGQERLCLAQISNTLLKSYSYNEIHNRRVALGITCVQCTPVQLEILRRAGAMPISSRRCGMITKREAERLCKSFLGEHRPPKLPENFAFDVAHECAWGSRGSFIPARYNSSRAKCIKCGYCSLYFSPNKFIFHSHRLPDAKYTQPDAANFNSWRRHLRLSDKGADDELSHAWEDVKAMFNGGTRKRTFSLHGGGGSSSLSKGSPASSSSSSSSASSSDLPPVSKALRCGPEQPALALSAPHGAGPSPSAVRSYPVIPVPSKGFGLLQKLPPPLFPPPYAFPAFGLCPKKQDDALGGNGGGNGGEPGKALPPGMFWGPPQQQQPPLQPPKESNNGGGGGGGVYPPFPMFWPASGSLPVPPYPQQQSQAKAAAATAVVVAAAAAAAAAAAEPLGLRGGQLPPHMGADPPSGGEGRGGGGGTPHEASAPEGERCPSANAAAESEERGATVSVEEALLLPLPLPRKGSYLSAFRPVVKDAESIAKLYGSAREAYGGGGGGGGHNGGGGPPPRGYLSPDFLSEEGSASYRSLSPGNEALDPEEEEEEEDEEEPDVDVEGHRFAEEEEEGEEREQDGEAPEEERREEREPTPTPAQPPEEKGAAAASAEPDGKAIAVVEEGRQSRGGYEQVFPPQTREDPPPALKASLALPSGPGAAYLRSPDRNGEESLSIDVIAGTQLGEKDFGNMARDELQKLLLEQMELRKKLEREFQSLKDNFQDQMKRELAYREEMVQQLQIVRDTLCNELDQERKARYAIQQKLKEAHDALHHFSCKMLTPRHCTGTCSFKPPLLPQ